MEKRKSDLAGFGMNDDSSSGRLLQLQNKNAEPARGGSVQRGRLARSAYGALWGTNFRRLLNCKLDAT